MSQIDQNVNFHQFLISVSVQTNLLWVLVSDSEFFPLHWNRPEDAYDQATLDKNSLSIHLSAYSLTPIAFHWDDWLSSRWNFILLSDSKILCSHRQRLLLDWLTKLLHIRLSSDPFDCLCSDSQCFPLVTGMASMHQQLRLHEITRDKWLDRPSSSLIPCIIDPNWLPSTWIFLPASEWKISSFVSTTASWPTDWIESYEIRFSFPLTGIEWISQ